ncbi:uncharacterized protein LOC115634033 [Scaptodrosophila lebanonensis]|uniref:Uncharacterized protein LOC115634033 n=1 Tax=Drosophila lebanonensis TaxID=7225 RepID=A0A6J2UG69_DROLE|nr:uncharacterized protein LOC115634033 [Scaptodrosophila lebanonensis]
MLHDNEERPQIHIKHSCVADEHTMDKSDACSMSSLSSESDLSLAFERDLNEPTDYDELPAFEIRAFSPQARTPSPIDNDLFGADVETPKQQKVHRQQGSPGRENNPEFVALHEINAKISPPSDSTEDSMVAFSRSNSLETIFEGIVLHTPPREKVNNGTPRCTPNRNRANILEMVAINRIQGGKEDQFPTGRVISPRKESAQDHDQNQQGELT